MRGLDSVGMKQGTRVSIGCITVDVRAVPRGWTHGHMALGWQLTEPKSWVQGGDFLSGG